MIKIGDDKINLFEDKRGDWEYGFIEYPEITAFGEKHVDIRRKAGATIEDDVQMKWKDQWLSMHEQASILKNTNIDDLSEEFLFFCCAVSSAVSFALNQQDHWRTHNARQKPAASGKARVAPVGTV